MIPTSNEIARKANREPTDQQLSEVWNHLADYCDNPNKHSDALRLAWLIVRYSKPADPHRFEGMYQDAEGKVPVVPEGAYRDLIQRLRKLIEDESFSITHECRFCHTTNCDHAEPGSPLLEVEDLTRLLSSPPQPAGGVAEAHNIRKVERTGDQSVTVTLASCRAASAFERAVTPKECES